MYGLSTPFRTAVRFWGQTAQILSSLPPKRDCGPKILNLILRIRKLKRYRITQKEGCLTALAATKRVLPYRGSAQCFRGSSIPHPTTAFEARRKWAFVFANAGRFSRPLVPSDTSLKGTTGFPRRIVGCALISFFVRNGLKARHTTPWTRCLTEHIEDMFFFYIGSTDTGFAVRPVFGHQTCRHPYRNTGTGHNPKKQGKYDADAYCDNDIPRRQNPPRFTVTAAVQNKTKQDKDETKQNKHKTKQNKQNKN